MPDFAPNLPLAQELIQAAPGHAKYVRRIGMDPVLYCVYDAVKEMRVWPADSTRHTAYYRVMKRHGGIFRPLMTYHVLPYTARAVPCMDLDGLALLLGAFGSERKRRAVAIQAGAGQVVGVKRVREESSSSSSDDDEEKEEEIEYCQECPPICTCFKELTLEIELQNARTRGFEARARMMEVEIKLLAAQNGNSLV